jgi:NADPH:quinone reductase-like Zn-dependent oxidoreductase
VRALAARATGGTEQLKVEEIPAPQAGAGQVLVRVHAAAANPADGKVVRGELAGRFLHARRFPLVPGYDLAGVVEAVGSGVGDLAAGDRVYGHLPYSGKNDQGSFAELVAVPAGEIGRLPAAVAFETAAAAATTGLTALQGLRDRGGLAAGGRALVLGAAGGVGTIAVGVAKKLGATVTAVASPKALDLVKTLGADEVVARAHGEPVNLEGPFDVVFDTPAAYGYVACRRMLSPGGAYVTTLPTGSLVAGKLMTLFSRRRARLLVVKSVRADLELMGGWLAEGLPVPIDSRFPVSDAGRAIDRLAQGGMRGRVVVDVAGGW